MPPVIIQLQNLTKKYGTRTAVKDLNLDVFTGDIFGFVGPNGAGKTSTLRMIATLLQPTNGEILVAGHPVGTEPRQVRKAIGYMPDFFGVYQDMKVWEYLDFFGACYGIPPEERAALINDLLELVELQHRREDMVDGLSRGMKQRLSLARTLVHDPQVLLLDEPASGLDPRARVEIRALLVELAKMGKTIFFSTHILADVAEICTRVAIIEAGELVAVGDLDELQQRLLPVRRVEVTLMNGVDQARSMLASTPGVEAVQEVTPLRPEAEGEPGQPAAPRNGRSRLEFTFAGKDADLTALLAGLVQAGIPVLDFHADDRDLEEVFMRATRGLVT